jgi:hypothetical protein
MLLACTHERGPGFGAGRAPEGRGETQAAPVRTWGMISRPTLIAALVVVELAIVGLAANALGSGHIGPTIIPPSIAGFTGPNGFSGPPGPQSSSSTPIDRSFVTGPSPHVNIDVHDDVDVTVETGTLPTVSVVESVAMHGFVSGHPAPLSVMQTPDGIRITSAGDDALHVMVGSVSHSLHLIVPPTARVELTTAGTIDVSGLREKLVAHTRDGWLHVRDHRGDLDVRSDDGRIELVDVQGDSIDAIANDGRIYLTRVGADHLNAHSDSGRIVGESIRAVDGGFTTLDGRIVVSFTAASDATAIAHTDDGDIEVSGFRAVDSGDRRRTVTLGAGHGHFELSTGDGPIMITAGANG